ncbi:hypothetical protein TWF679_003581 [Orbilia oligospora]|uniref:Uncharacterized protein n=1 Tax=Orbilia oligospora TaxID=2813651 RepID=A0A8H8UR56_ORBOL|nr:hypothetical protein TWF679_003581 [Orbilia oligospora]
MQAADGISDEKLKTLISQVDDDNNCKLIELKAPTSTYQPEIRLSGGDICLRRPPTTFEIKNIPSMATLDSTWAAKGKEAFRRKGPKPPAANEFVKLYPS